MPRKRTKVQHQDLWIPIQEAVAIMSANSEHPVSADYIRLLSNQKKIRALSKTTRMKVYHRGDVEAYRVKAKKTSKAGRPGDEHDR